MPHQCTNCDRTFPNGSKEMLSGCPDCGGNKFRFRPEGGQLGDSTDLDPTPDDTPPDPPGPTDDGVTGSVGRAAAAVRDRLGGSAGPGDADGSAGPGDAEDSVGPAGVDGLGPVDDGARVERTPSPGADAPDTGSTDPPDTGSADFEESGTTDPGGSGVDDSRESSGDDPDPWFDSASTGSIEAEMGDEEDDAQASARSSVVDPSDLPGGTAPGTDASPPDAPASGPADERGSPSTGTPDGSGGQDDEPDLASLREELNEQFESIKIVEPGQYELNLMELYDRDEYIISLMEDGRYAIEVPERWRDGD